MGAASGFAANIRGEIICSRKADEDDEGDQARHPSEEEMLARS